MHSFITVFFLTLEMLSVIGDPSYCSYDKEKLEYSCDARSWYLPLRLSQFSKTPQSMVLYDVNGELPGTGSGTFQDFDTINTASLDSNVIPTLTIRCNRGGRLIITQGTFTGMSHIKELFIVNCEVLALPNRVFTNLATLNFLQFEGGSMADMGFDAFVGLDIYPMDIRNPKGALSFKHVQISGNRMPNGILFALKNVVTIEIDNCAIDHLQKDMFVALTKVKQIDISRNAFTTVPSGLFDGLNALGTVFMHGISWSCSCSDLWFTEFFKSSNISLYADVVCSSPTDYSGKRAKQYYDGMCATTNPCEGKSGIAVSNHCLTMEQLGNLGFGIGCIFLAALAVIFILHLRKQLKEAEAIKTDSKFEFKGVKRASGPWDPVGSGTPIPDDVPIIETREPSVVSGNSGTGTGSSSEYETDDSDDDAGDTTANRTTKVVVEQHQPRNSVKT